MVELIKIENNKSHISVTVNLHKGLMALGTLSGLSALLYARYLERVWLEVTRHKVSVPGLPEAWRGFRFAWLSDLHLGYKASVAPVSEAFERVVAERPDLIVLGGDYLDRGRWRPVCDELFGRLASSGIPIIGVWGNHDYFGNRMDPLKNQEHFRRLGIRMLINETYCIERGGIPQYIVGVDDTSKGAPDLLEATKQLPLSTKPLLLLSHNPNFMRRVPDNFCELVLSGHTHGGQVNPAPPPFHRSLNWIKFSRSRQKHYSRYPQGWYEVRGNRLYVGRGVGVTGRPIRLGARPEAPIFELQPA